MRVVGIGVELLALAGHPICRGLLALERGDCDTRANDVVLAGAPVETHVANALTHAGSSSTVTVNLTDSPGVQANRPRSSRREAHVAATYAVTKNADDGAAVVAVYAEVEQGVTVALVSTV